MWRWEENEANRKTICMEEDLCDLRNIKGTQGILILDVIQTHP